MVVICQNLRFSLARSAAEMIIEARRKQRRLSPWLRVHHDELVPVLGRSRIDWAPVLETIRRLQLVDARGRSPSTDTVAKAWRRVREQVAREQAKIAEARDPLQIVSGVRILASSNISPAQSPAGDRAPSGQSGDDRPAPILPAAGNSAAVQLTPTGEEGMPDRVRHARDRVGLRTAPLPTD